MQLTAYELALIAGGFALCGVFVGVLLTYRLALKLADHNALRAGGANLRAAFAPTLAHLNIARSHSSTHEAPNIDQYLVDVLPHHAAAVEEYRFFVAFRERAAYQQAWEEYRQAAMGGKFVAEFVGHEDPFLSLEQKIHGVLRFAKT